MSEEDSANKKRKLSEDPNELSREEVMSRLQTQKDKIDELTQNNRTEAQNFKETIEKLKNQVSESSKNENLLLLRLAAKDQEVQELMSQIQEIKSQTPSTTHLRSTLLDPSVNLLFQHMKTELNLTKSKLEQAQKDLAAWKFSPDSQTGKRLMAKCRMLIQENEDLGKVVSSGRIAKLEGDIALQKKLISEMRHSEEETEKCLAELEETIETMQCTIFSLQTELSQTKQQLNKYLHICKCLQPPDSGRGANYPQDDHKPNSTDTTSCSDTGQENVLDQQKLNSSDNIMHDIRDAVLVNSD